MIFTAADLPLPDAFDSADMRAIRCDRKPGDGAISIQCGFINAQRHAYRAFGLVFIAYLLSPQRQPLRIRLSGAASHEIGELVLWPGRASMAERELGFRQHIDEVTYRPTLHESHPNFGLSERQPEHALAAEYLPYCRLGALAFPGGEGFVRPGEPTGLHFAGTAASMVWMGKYLLNLALSDNPAVQKHFYNFNEEMMAPGSGELRLIVSGPDSVGVF